MYRHSRNTTLVTFISIIAYTLIWYGLFWYSGIKNSSFGWLDDWQIVSESHEFESGTTDSLKLLKKDLSGKRFKPLWSIQRSLSIKYLGTNHAAWITYHIFLAVLTCSLLFIFAIKRNFSLLISFFFPLFVFLGKQSAIFFKFNLGEGIGMLFLSIILLLVTYSCNSISKRKKVVSDIFIIILTILMTLCKESFILIVPSLIFFYIYMYKEENNISFIRSLKINFILATLLMFIMMIEITYIILFLKSYYIGTDALPLIPSLIKTSSFLFSKSIYLISILIAFIPVILMKLLSRKHTNNSANTIFKSLLFPAIFSGLIIGPQIYIYCKTGMDERYIIPAFLGVTFLAISIYRKIQHNEIFRNYHQIVFLIAFIIPLVALTNQGIQYAKVHAHLKNQTKLVFDTIKNNTQKLDKILLVADPARNYEQILASMIFFYHSIERPNIYTNFIPDSNYKKHFKYDYDLLSKSTIRRYKDTNFEFMENKTDIKLVMILSKEEEFLKMNKKWFDPSKFNRAQFYRFTIYSG